MVQALITRENKGAFHRRFETRKNNQSGANVNKLPVNKSIISLRSDEEDDGGNGLPWDANQQLLV